jgi:Fur family peroxide stress response transcriptional regulator
MPPAGIKRFRLSHTPETEFVSQKLDALQSACRERGLPVTVQRRTVLERLAEHPGHPTVDELFEIVSRDLPRISRTTVYRILEALVEMGLAHKAMHPGAIVRYDVRTETHDHILCEVCGRIFDYDDPSLPRPELPSRPPDGFEVTAISVLLRGICPDCRNRRSA